MLKTMLGTLALMAITCTVQPVGQVSAPASPRPSGSQERSGGPAGGSVGVTVSAGPATVMSPPPPTVGVQAATATGSGGPPLLAAIEATETTSGPHFNAVAVAGADGRARAKASFAAVSAPTLPGGDVVILPNAQVVGGTVYFMDGRGVVRRLARDGSVSLVATFPLSGGQQEASFAVSPDGTQLAASVLALPDGQGPYKLDVETASPGQAATAIRHAESAGPPAADDTPPPAGSPPSQFANLQVVGWDSQGPIALVGSQLVVNNDPYLAGHRFFGGHLARLGADGTPGSTLGGDGCRPYSLEAGDIVVCARALGPSQAIGVSLRTTAGRVLWSVDAGEGCFAPSPDRRRLAMKGSVKGQDGSNVALNDSFCPLGWLDDQTLVGTAADVHWFAPYPLSLVHLSHPTQAVDLGFSAWYAGTL